MNNIAEPQETEAEKNAFTDRLEEFEKKVNRKAGRNLFIAIAVGVLLAAIVIGSVVFGVFTLVAVLFALVATWELSRALRREVPRLPVVVLYIGAILLPVAAHYWGVTGLWFSLIGVTGVAVIFRFLLGGRDAGRGIAVSAWIVTYISFFVAFTVLISDLPDGAAKLLVFLGLIVANDTFAYATGVFFGKHPLAPLISPNKTWEGFAGALLGSSLLGILLGIWFLEATWWAGALLGAAVVLSGTVGDLTESSIKRELGVKDMGKALPGHGGVLDRIDSILVAAPVVYLLFVAVPLMDGL